MIVSIYVFAFGGVEKGGSEDGVGEIGGGRGEGGAADEYYYPLPPRGMPAFVLGGETLGGVGGACIENPFSHLSPPSSSYSTDASSPVGCGCGCDSYPFPLFGISKKEKKNKRG